MELQNPELFLSFLKKNLNSADFDGDAYLEKLIIHWGETGEASFTLDAGETLSGQPETIAFCVDTIYYIREGREKVIIEDLSEGYDGYDFRLRFTSDASVIPEDIPIDRKISPLGLIRHKSGKTLRSISEVTGIDPETLLAYEQPTFDIGSLPLHTAADIAKALNVHAEDLLHCAPTAPRSLRK